MNQKRPGFGTRIGFELAAAGSAVGLGNLWGFPYKTSANGGAAYLFVYLACILLVGAVAMLAEFTLGRRSRANTVSAYKAVSPNLGWLGLLVVVIPALIMCYYLVLGGYTVKYALGSFVGNAGKYEAFAGNVGDVILHTAVFALPAALIVIAGVRNGIEKAAKLLLPTMLLILIVISCVSLLLGEGVHEGLAFYLKPDFSKLTGSGILSAMGQAFFSLSLGCGAMIAYGSYSGQTVDLARSTVVVCLLDGLLTFLSGLAIFPALFHYAAISGASLSSLGMGGAGLTFITLPMVFEGLGLAGQIISLLFFTMMAIAALTSIISILEVVTQFIIQRHKLARTRAVSIVAFACLALSVPVGISLGLDVNGSKALCLFGRNLLELLDGVTNTLLMPLGALGACLAVGWKLPKAERFSGFTGTMLRIVTPVLIVLILVFGAVDMVFPATEAGRAFSADGFGMLMIAAGVVLLTIIAYFLWLKNRDTGSNQDEEAANAKREEAFRAGLQRGWQRPE